ncbi:unnamed protein product [Penicillium roqueforti FM164]|uniref:Genomic scaffold, ProqFM164S01 n=1 Tax=Penicillium roqueforti (strain FM164) TaxID=1365484 RepID=W6Q6G2_PENRF|nr:unnamed protein product [Penicillium roqueforti FM164]
MIFGLGRHRPFQLEDDECQSLVVVDIYPGETPTAEAHCAIVATV